MKKLLILAAAGVLCLGAATEAAAYDTYVLQPPVAQLTSGGTYYIYDASGDDGSATEIECDGYNSYRYAFRYDSGAANAETAAVHGTHIKPVNITTELENKHVWTALQQEDGTWMFMNVATNRYMATNNPQTTSVEANFGKFDVETTSTTGAFTVKVSGTVETRWDGNGPGNYPMVYWGGTGHKISFYAAVAEDDGYKMAADAGWNVTYTYPVFGDGGAAFQQTVSVPDGADANAYVPACNYFSASGVTATGESAVVKEGQTSFTVAGQWAYPMEIGKVYRVRLNPFNNDTKSIKLDGENVKTRHTDTNINSSAFLWYFDLAEHSNGELKVQMHTIAAEETKGLQFGTGDDSRATLSDTPTALLVQHTNCGNTTASDFCLKVDGADNWINERNPYFSTWNNSSSLSGQGSVIRLSALADDDIDAIAAISGCEAEVVAAAKANASQQNIRALFEGVNEYYVQAVNYIDNADAFAALGVAPADAVSAWNAVKEELAITRENADEAKVAALLAAYEALVSSSANTAGGAHLKLCPNKARTDLLGGRLVDGAYVFEYYGADVNQSNTTWTVEAAEGGFNLFNEYSGKYIKFPTQNEGSTGATPENTRVRPVVAKDDASVFMFDLFDAVTGRVGIKYVGADADNTYRYIHQTGNGRFVVRWNKIAENSSWYLQASDADTAESEANLGANDDVANAGEYAALPENIGSALGQFTIGNRDEYDAALAALNALGDDATNADKHAAAAALRAARAALEIRVNAPLAGRFYRLQGVEGNAGKFLSSTLSGGKLSIADANNADGTNTDNSLATVFYFDGTHLIDMAAGMALANGNAHNLVLAADSNAGTITFVAAPQTGAFNIKSGSRYLYNANSTLVSGDNNENGKVGYAWHITEVQYLPIPGSGEAYSTICLPVDVNRDYRRSMVVLTPEIKNGKVVLTPMTDHVLPANTPYVLYNNGETQNGNLIYLHIVGCHDDAVASVTAAKAEGVNYISLNGNKFSALEGDVVPGFQYVPQVETAQDHAFGYNLVTPGKVYTIKNTDIGNNRGYLMHKADEDRMWTSGKFGLSNDAADEAAPANADYHWTLVEDNDGNRYLYNLGAKQFAGAYGKLNSAIAEFYWHFSEVPTAVEVDFLDQAPAFDMSNAKFNVIGGDNTVNPRNRPAGMTIVNGNLVSPVGCTNNAANDGCTYFFTEVAGAGLPDDLPTAADIEAVKAKMHANHAAAVENIGNWNEDDAANHVGYFTAEGFSAFSNAINAAEENATAEAKHYAYVRAKIASEGKVLEFVDGNVYNVCNADGEYYYAVAAKQDSGFYETSVATAANLDSENVDFNWLAAVGEDGTVTLSHSFLVYQPVEAPASRAAATTVKSTITHNLVEAVAPAHDGFGNSTLGQNLVVTAVNRDDKPETTAIEEISLDERAGADVIYDLQGRRVSRAAKGVYIINGKKTLVK